MAKREGSKEMKTQEDAEKSGASSRLKKEKEAATVCAKKQQLAVTSPRVPSREKDTKEPKTTNVATATRGSKRPTAAKGGGGASARSRRSTRGGPPTPSAAAGKSARSTRGGGAKSQPQSPDDNNPNKSLINTIQADPLVKNTAKDFAYLEEQILKLPCYHGFIGREDLMCLLKNVGDYLIRLSVQANKQELEKRKKNAADVKVIGNLSREKAAKKEKEKAGKIAQPAGDVGRREFVISVHCKDLKPVSANKPIMTPIRNLVIKRDDGLISVEPTKKFKTLSEFLAFYLKNTGLCKETEFTLLRAIPLASWEFQHDDIELQEKRLGEGAFGEVRVGKMKMKETKKTIEVAVKMLRNSDVATREQVSELLHEARVMRMMDHRNVLRSYGVAVLHEPLYLMTELCGGGALREYLKENKDKVTLAEKLSFVLGAARGVEYLHCQKTIHRDLAVRNILITDDKTPKVSDFGLAKVTDRYEMREQCKIPVRYLAPETLENFVFTPKTDVFSFGCVIWEIYENGQQPHDGKNAQTIRQQTKKNHFLKLTAAAPDELKKLVAERVFTPDPENRCSMTAIVQCVEKIEKPKN